MTLLDALRAIHDGLWDPERSMTRYAPGVVPGVDISTFDLHSVRETALGAFLDLDDGNVERAITGLRKVVALQYPLSSWPWAGTFPVTAEQAEPPGADAVEWFHYDPNWRQFIGCILALTVIHHGDDLPIDLHAAIDHALTQCARGEPQGRIAPWYTNPNLMHAWLLGHVGQSTGDAELIASGEARLGLIMERFDRFGDIDEYNSPTYDGIDLFAVALWVMHPPDPTFGVAGARMIERLGERISALHHPGLGAMCGPYIRAYGLDLDRYVSLAGLWLHLAGAPTGHVLPSNLNDHTVHVHDLYFLPVIARLAPAVLERIELRPVIEPRRHVQKFGDARAESMLLAHVAIGWERGRRHTESLDQYVPFTAHFELDGVSTSVGIMVPDETAWIDCRAVDDTDGSTFELRAAGRSDTVGLIVVSGVAPSVDEHHLALGPWTLEPTEPPIAVDVTPTATGYRTHLRWERSQVTAEMTVRV